MGDFLLRAAGPAIMLMGTVFLLLATAGLTVWGWDSGTCAFIAVNGLFQIGTGLWCVTMVAGVPR